jgi:3-oxoacyl-ACP reductase-like protein
LRREKIEKAKKRKFDKESKVYRQRWRVAVGRLKREALGSIKADIELGELAPRRDIGLEAEKFATLPDIFTSKPSAHRNVFERLYKKRQSSTELFRSYKVNDKVIIVNGIGKGRVGFIEEVHWETQKVKLSGMFLVCLWI